MRLRYLLAVAGVLALATSCAPGAGDGFLWGSAATAMSDRLERERQFAHSPQQWGPICKGWDWQFLSTAMPAEVDSCLAAGARVNERDGAGRTPLHDVARFNDTPAVTWILLDAGAQVDARDGDGATPLHFAALENNNPAIIRTLILAGAWVNERDAEHNATPLHYAAFGNDNPAIITALLDAGADAGARDAYGRTPWDLAQDNEALKGTDAWLRLNEGRFR